MFKEGVNYYLIYDNNGSKELVYTSELVVPTPNVLENMLSFNFDVAATQGSLLNLVIARNGRGTQTQPGVYAAGRVIVTNGKVSIIDNYSLHLEGGKDAERLNFAKNNLQEAGLTLYLIHI